jgi:hypothetical protein
MVADRKDEGFERVINSAGTLVRTRYGDVCVCVCVCVWRFCSDALSSFSCLDGVCHWQARKGKPSSPTLGFKP